jgi:Leucyl aminopeptidase (aminopeptidase T)
MAYTNNYKEEMNKGVENLLGCLDVKQGDSILLIYTPESNYDNTIKNAKNLFWREPSDAIPDSEWKEQKEILGRDRREIFNSIIYTCQKWECPLTLFPLDIYVEEGQEKLSILWELKTKIKWLESKIKWLESKIKWSRSKKLQTPKRSEEKGSVHLSFKEKIEHLDSQAVKSNIALDFSLLGLDNYLINTTNTLLMPPKTLRQYLITKGMRGMDVHNLTADSLIDGAMREDYTKMKNRIDKIYTKIVRNGTNIVKVKQIYIKDDHGLVDLTLNVQDDTPVIKATGILDHLNGERWHYLPSGGISICIDHTRVTGHVTLNGPMWGVENLQYKPVRLEIEKKSEGKMTLSSSCNNAAINQLLKLEDVGPYIGEIFFGFNTRADRDSELPLEFYVANNTVTLGIGRNDHLGGKNPIKPQESTPKVHSHARIDCTSVTLSYDPGEFEIIMMDGKWVSE